MKRPIKKELKFNSSVEEKARIGYNQACDDWEEFLPREEEILIMLIVKLQHTYEDGLSRRETAEKLAKAISKRIRGEG